MRTAPRGRSSGSRTIIMEFIHNSLVEQVNLSSRQKKSISKVRDVHHVIPERHQYKKTILSCGSPPGMVLTLSPDVGLHSSLLVTSPQSTAYARGHIKSTRYHSKPLTISYKLHTPGSIRGSNYRLAAPPTIRSLQAITKRRRKQH